MKWINVFNRLSDYIIDRFINLENQQSTTEV